MQLANILEPEENISYVIGKFKEHLVETCEDLKSNDKDLKAFEKQIEKILSGDKKKKVDAHSFIEYITGKDLEKYMATIRPKATKKKPLSFDRLSMIIMPIFKYFEQEKVFKAESLKIVKTLELWLKFVQSQKEQNINTLFETQLNLFLVLSEDTVMKSIVFQHLTKFLLSHGQLQAVMIAQVRDIIKLSSEWNLTKDERLSLYIECAQALDQDGDAQGAFNLYFHSLSLIDAKNASKYQKEAEKLIVNAVKGPQVINFEEIMMVDAVQDLKKTSKELFEFVDLFLKADVAAFKKNLSKMNKLMEAQKITMEQATLKKQYIDVCNVKSENISFKDLAKLLDIKEDDLEEWVIEAMSNDVIDAKIDQVKEIVIIKTSKMRNLQKEDWQVIVKKIQEWKQRFERIEKILQVQPETK